MPSGHVFENLVVAVRRFVDLLCFQASCVYALTVFERKSRTDLSKTAPKSIKNGNQNNHNLCILARGGHCVPENNKSMKSRKTTQTQRTNIIRKLVAIFSKIGGLEGSTFIVVL